MCSVFYYKRMKKLNEIVGQLKVVFLYTIPTAVGVNCHFITYYTYKNTILGFRPNFKLGLKRFCISTHEDA